MQERAHKGLVTQLESEQTKASDYHKQVLTQHVHTFRVAKTHRMHYLIGRFLQKSPIISGSFAKNDLKIQATKASDYHKQVSTQHVYTYTCAYPCIGWRRPLGCLKLKVVFRKRATNSRALLRKMTFEDKASYDSTPPCTHMGWLRLVGSFKS